MEDLNIATILKNMKHLQSAVDASVLTNDFSKKYIGHTKRNIINLDSDNTDDYEEIDLYS